MRVFLPLPGYTVPINQSLSLRAGSTAFPGRSRVHTFSINLNLSYRAIEFTAFSGSGRKTLTFPINLNLSYRASYFTAIHSMSTTISLPTMSITTIISTTTEPTTERQKRKNVSIKPKGILTKKIIVEVVLSKVCLVPATGEEPARQARNTLLLAQEILEPESVGSIAVIIPPCSVRGSAHHTPHRGEGFTDLFESIALAVSNNFGTNFFDIACVQFLLDVFSSLGQALSLLASPLHQHAGRDGLHVDSVTHLGRLFRGISTLRLLDSLLHHVQVRVQSVTGHGVRYWLYSRTAGTTGWGVLLC